MYIIFFYISRLIRQVAIQDEMPSGSSIKSVSFQVQIFHVASEPTYFTLGGEETSKFAIFKDRNLKFGDNVHF